MSEELTAAPPIPEIDQALIAPQYIHEAGEYALSPLRSDGHAFTAAGGRLCTLIGALVLERDEWKCRAITSVKFEKTLSERCESLEADLDEARKGNVSVYDHSALKAAERIGFERCKTDIRRTLIAAREYPLCQWEIDAAIDAIQPGPSKPEAEC